MCLLCLGQLRSLRSFLIGCGFQTFTHCRPPTAGAHFCSVYTWCLLQSLLSLIFCSMWEPPHLLPWLTVCALVFLWIYIVNQDKLMVNSDSQVLFFVNVNIFILGISPTYWIVSHGELCYRARPFYKQKKKSIKCCSTFFFIASEIPCCSIYVCISPISR